MQISCSSIDKTFVLPKQSKTSCQTLKWMRIPPNFTFKPYITGSDAESFRTMLDFPLSRHVKWSLHLIPLPPPRSHAPRIFETNSWKLTANTLLDLTTTATATHTKKLAKIKKTKFSCSVYQSTLIFSISRKISEKKHEATVKFTQPLTYQY